MSQIDDDKVPAGEDVNESPDNPQKNDEKAALQAMTDNRADRDDAIEEGEKEYYTEARQREVLEKESLEFAESLKKNEQKIEAAIGKMTYPLSSPGELPSFLQAAGIEQDAVDALRKSFPLEDRYVKPKNRNMIKALFETINRYFTNKDFQAGSFASAALDSFRENRSKIFVEEVTAYSKYEDRFGRGFYRTPEGAALIKAKTKKD